MPVSFSKQPSPLLLSVLRFKTTKQVLAAVQSGIMHGAGGFDLHLSFLEESALTEDSLRRIFRSTRKPFMALHYNIDSDGNKLSFTDEQRMELLLRAVKAGAAAIDMQGYTFDNEDTRNSLELGKGKPEMSFISAVPEEVCLKPVIIEKQKAFINTVHSMGAEVVLSTHTRVVMSCEQVVDLALFLEQRGADVIKIVTDCKDKKDIDECYKTVLALKSVLKTPFSLHYVGCGRVTRVIAPLLGSYLVFCNDGYTPECDFNQLDLQTMYNALHGLEWRKDL